MKKFLLVLLFLVLNIAFAQNIHWQHLDTSVFEKAKKLKKPVILHLAANWCHWCHVMEEQTYHHPKVVDYINKYFIACMEDHDQRPDLANKYRDYGWPATIIFSYGGKELFKNAGYIEAEEYLKILKEIKEGKIKSSTKNNTNASTSINSSTIQKNISLIQKDVMNNIDVRVGGFKSEQKSLDFEMFEYAFNHYNNDTLKQWLDISVKNSLDLMDNVWGGVYQYSTHRDWKHAHYEKLLSIQARYVKMYLWYYYLSNDSTYYKAAIKNYEYVNRFLKKKNGTYANAQDADLIKGQKAHDYYASSEAERLKQGIPAIDTNAFTDNNSKWAESLIYLYAYSGNQKYLQEAEQTIQYILQYRKREDGFFNHGSMQDITPAIVDQMYFAKTLLLFYRLNGNLKYREFAIQLLDLVVEKFFSNNCIKSYLPVKNYLEPDCIVSENIEMARILNLYGKIFYREKWISAAKVISDYLLSDDVYDKIIIEPGILSLREEVVEEPYIGLYVVHKLNEIDNNVVRALLKVPKFYMFSFTMKDKNDFPDKEDIWDSMDNNVVFFCTSTFCSSPLFSDKEINQFLLLRVLNR
ncbi:MAG: DUF255 domain-containing protein [Bacteroidota bacterium]